MSLETSPEHCTHHPRHQSPQDSVFCFLSHLSKPRWLFVVIFLTPVTMLWPLQATHDAHCHMSQRHNDNASDAIKLSKLLHSLHVHVSLIVPPWHLHLIMAHDIFIHHLSHSTSQHVSRVTLSRWSDPHHRQVVTDGRGRITHGHAWGDVWWSQVQCSRVKIQHPSKEKTRMNQGQMKSHNKNERCAHWWQFVYAKLSLKSSLCSVLWDNLKRDQKWIGDTQKESHNENERSDVVLGPSWPQATTPWLLDSWLRGGISTKLSSPGCLRVKEQTGFPLTIDERYFYIF